MKFKLRKNDPDGERRGWPKYIFWGRVRTSTFALAVAFFVTWWLYQTYQPPPEVPEVPATQVVPPGFVPDPDYTWVPRTQLRESETTTPTTTETTTPTEPTTPTESPNPGTSTPTSAPPGTPGPTPSPTTTVGAGPGPSLTPSPRAQ